MTLKQRHQSISDIVDPSIAEIECHLMTLTEHRIHQQRLGHPDMSFYVFFDKLMTSYRGSFDSQKHLGVIQHYFHGWGKEPYFHQIDDGK
jgi:hypothetical protein